MSYGMTPYDKKSYKASKRRRRQALIADKTGKILPISTNNNRLFVLMILIVLFVALVVSGVLLYNYLSYQPDNNDNAQEIVIAENQGLLIDVDRNNPLDADFIPELSDFNGIKVNSVLYDNLSDLVNSAKQDEIELTVKSGYISFDEQQSMHDDMLKEYLENPEYTKVRAEATVSKIVPKGGQSEAQTGLLVEFDISDNKVSSYLERVCVDYGFILRFPEDKQDITGMDYSSSLYRYVGKDNAIKMRSYNMCLEEYNKYLEIQKKS